MATKTISDLTTAIEVKDTDFLLVENGTNTMKVAKKILLFGNNCELFMLFPSLSATIIWSSKLTPILPSVSFKVFIPETKMNAATATPAIGSRYFTKAIFFAKKKIVS